MGIGPRAGQMLAAAAATIHLKPFRFQRSRQKTKRSPNRC
jgi:hypothetical protein